MSFPSAIQTDIAVAIVNGNNSLFTSRPREYVPTIEKKIIELANNWIMEARRASKVPNTFSVNMENTMYCSDENYKLITDIMKKVFDLNCQLFPASYLICGKRDNELHPVIFARQPLVPKSMAFSWTPQNKFIYSNEPVVKLLEAKTAPAFTYSKETHFEILYQRAQKGKDIDVRFVFSDGRMLNAHGIVLAAHSEAFELKSHTFDYSHPVFPINDCTYETMDRVLKFMYLAKFPEDISEDFLGLTLLKEFAEKYKVKALVAWSEFTIQRQVEKLFDPERDLLAGFLIALSFKNKAALEKCFAVAEKSDEKMTELMSRITSDNFDFVSSSVTDSNVKVMKALMAKSRELMSQK